MTSNDNGFVILQFLLTKSMGRGLAQFSAQDITRLKLLGRDAILLSEAPRLPSTWLLSEFISLWLYDYGPMFLLSDWDHSVPRGHPQVFNS